MLVRFSGFSLSFSYYSIPVLKVVELVLGDLSAEYPDMIFVVLASPFPFFLFGSFIKFFPLLGAFVP